MQRRTMQGTSSIQYTVKKKKMKSIQPLGELVVNPHSIEYTTLRERERESVLVHLNSRPIDAYHCC